MSDIETQRNLINLKNEKVEELSVPTETYKNESRLKYNVPFTWYMEEQVNVAIAQGNLVRTESYYGYETKYYKTSSLGEIPVTEL